LIREFPLTGEQFAADCLIPREELEVTHLLQIEADGIRRLADRISGRLR
jgi:hypothetical protein